MGWIVSLLRYDFDRCERDIAFPASEVIPFCSSFRRMQDEWHFSAAARFKYPAKCSKTGTLGP
jgi:hypothetical protein